MNIVNETGSYKNTTASVAVAGNAANLMGVWVSSASATPTIKIWDNSAASGAIVANTFTPVAGSFYPIPATCVNGIYITIGGTVDCTVIYTPVV